MMLSYLKGCYSHSIKIGILVSLGIIVSQCLKIAMIYHFFSLDVSLALAAISFFLVGYFLSFTNITSNNIVFAELPSHQNTLVQIRNLAMATLTAREYTILEMLVQGKTNKEIAVTLSIEVSTVKTHINNSYAKLNCGNRHEARTKFKEYFSLKASTPKL
jgi:DNA-binding CsgD family transcriptional regulator